MNGRDSFGRYAWTRTSRSVQARLRDVAWFDLSRFGSQALGLLDGFLDGADHVEGGLGKVIVLAVDQTLEALDGVFKRDELAGRTGEDVRHVERLRQEALD